MVAKAIASIVTVLVFGNRLNCGFNSFAEIFINVALWKILENLV